VPRTPPQGEGHTPQGTLLNARAQDERLFVDDVVTALTGTVVPSGEPRPVFEDQMKRATEEFDLRTAEAFARALLEALCQEPIDPRRLEALLILGLAHPTILERHRISLPKEGERLAAMLAAQGQHDRARTLLDVIAKSVSDAAETEFTEPSQPIPTTAAGLAAYATSSVHAPNSNASASGDPTSPHPVERDHARIEMLLRQADEAAARGRTNQAILCLQEVVTLDRQRRDVTRMIRDLRWQAQDRRARSIRRSKLAAMVIALTAAAAGLAWREHGVRLRFDAIPRATPGELASLHARIESIDALISAEKAWIGMGTALSDRSELEQAAIEIESRETAKASEVRLDETRSLEIAESTRTRGMMLAQQGRFDDALVELRRALELGGTDWSARRDVMTNVTAIAEWIEKAPERKGHVR